MEFAAGHVEAAKNTLFEYLKLRPYSPGVWLM